MAFRYAWGHQCFAAEREEEMRQREVFCEER